MAPAQPAWHQIFASSRQFLVSLHFIPTNQQIMKLTNKVAYITGGSKGIGYGIAHKLLDEGMRVAITSRSLEAAQDAAKQLSTDTSKVLALQSDVSSMASEQEAIEAVLQHFGQLDVVVANAGVGHFAPIDMLSETQWKETIDTNLTGVFNTVKAGIEPLKKPKATLSPLPAWPAPIFLKPLRRIMPASSGWSVLPRPLCLTCVNMVSRCRPSCRALWRRILTIIHPMKQMPGKFSRKTLVNW